jgi:type II secretion system protein G
MKSRTTRGFTLVEVLIVVVILAILAATIIPKFSNSTSDAQSSSAQYNLHVLRSQIELYKAQHNGVPPTVAKIADQLTKKTKADGTVDAAGQYGPYIQSMPANPFNNSATVGATADNPPTAVAGSDGWLYNETAGQIWINEANNMKY